jgi:hypothetical protein
LSVVDPDVTVIEVPDNVFGSGNAETSARLAGPMLFPKTTNSEPCAMVVL